MKSMMQLCLLSNEVLIAAVVCRLKRVRMIAEKDAKPVLMQV